MNGKSPFPRIRLRCLLLFLYQKVLGVNLPWLDGLGGLPSRKRLPVVLSRDEVSQPGVASRRAWRAGAAPVRNGHAHHGRACG